MRILFLACLRAHTGNSTTAERIKDHLEAAGHTCVLRDAAALESPFEVTWLISQEKFDAGLAIHLYKAGRFLLGNNIPFGVIFGGTDINEDIKNEEKYRVMGAVLEEARFAVAFTHEIKETAEANWPHSKHKMHIQPQGILTKPSASFSWKGFLKNAGIWAKQRITDVSIMYMVTEDKVQKRMAKVMIWSSWLAPELLHFYFDKCVPQMSVKERIQNNSEHLHLFLLICGLRRVKDPLYLAETFAEWHKRDPNVHLAIIGPTVDPVFTKEVKAKLDIIDGIYLIEEIPQADLQAVVRRCYAVVNSSVSEGMSAAILEAMDLEVPVLARDIPGNAAIIKHEETGLLFSSPQEFVQLSKRLMSEPALKRRIISNAKQYVKTNHSWKLERENYQNLILSLELTR